MQTDNRFGRFNFRSLLASNDIDKNVQDHLKNVYSTLSIGLLLACCGTYIYLLSPIVQGMLTTLTIFSFIASLGCTMYIYFTPHSSSTIKNRLGAFLLFTFSTGLGLGPLIQVVSAINPSTIPTALLGAALIFVSFSLAALLTRKRYYLYLGAMLMSGLSLLGTFSLMNLFIRSPAIYQAELYIGFAIFCAFVIFDTQLIVQKRKCGDTDFIWHTLDLFIDLVELFRHLLIILNSKRNRREDED